MYYNLDFRLDKKDEFTPWGVLRTSEYAILKIARKLLKEMQFGEVKIARGQIMEDLKWWSTIEQTRPEVYYKEVNNHE